MAKKEVDGVAVEAKSILTSLRIIKTVCKDNECPCCPFGKVEEDGKMYCMVKYTPPEEWNINSETDVWRALS